MLMPAARSQWRTFNQQSQKMKLQEESGLSFGMHSSCRMDFQTWSFFIRPISTTGKTDSAPTWGCCWVVQEYVYVICSSATNRPHFTCSLVPAGGPTEWSKQAVPWSPSWQHAWGKPELSPQMKSVVWWAEPMHPADTEAQALLD